MRGFRKSSDHTKKRKKYFLGFLLLVCDTSCNNTENECFTSKPASKPSATVNWIKNFSPFPGFNAIFQRFRGFYETKLKHLKENY